MEGCRRAARIVERHKRWWRAYGVQETVAKQVQQAQATSSRTRHRQVREAAVRLLVACVHPYSMLEHLIFVRAGTDPSLTATGSRPPRKRQAVVSRDAGVSCAYEQSANLWNSVSYLCDMR